MLRRNVSTVRAKGSVQDIADLKLIGGSIRRKEDAQFRQLRSNLTGGASRQQQPKECPPKQGLRLRTLVHKLLLFTLRQCLQPGAVNGFHQRQSIRRWLAQ